MSGRPRSELASEEVSAMPQESVRQIQLKESLRLCVSAIKKKLASTSFVAVHYKNKLSNKKIPPPIRPASGNVMTHVITILRATPHFTPFAF